MSLPLPLLHPFGSPRKQRVKHRTALIALFSLLAFTCYLLSIAYPSVRLSKPILTHAPEHDRPRVPGEDHAVTAHRTAPYRKVKSVPAPAPRPPLALSPAEELAALAAFIAALPYNVLPSFVDPSVSLDPQLVLDFDTRGDTAREELDRVVEQIWARFPVMLFAKLHSSDSREVRHILSNMNLKPAPLVVEVDQREDGHILIPLLTRLTHVPALPILLIGGQPVGADAADRRTLMADIRNLHESGDLARSILDTGSTAVSERKKGKAH